MTARLVKRNSFKTVVCILCVVIGEWRHRSCVSLVAQVLSHHIINIIIIIIIIIII